MSHIYKEQNRKCTSAVRSAKKEFYQKVYDMALQDKKSTYFETADFFFAGSKSTVRPLGFYTAIFTAYMSRPYKKSSSYSCCTRADGNTTSLRFSTTAGRERTVPGRAPPHTPLVELRLRTQFPLPPGTSYLPTSSRMLDAWISFLRHSARH